MRHPVCDLDKKHVVSAPFTCRELEILKRTSEYYANKARFCRTLIQKNFAIEISEVLRKTIKL